MRPRKYKQAFKTLLAVMEKLLAAGEVFAPKITQMSWRIASYNTK
jgi:hypothetical protein